MSFKNTITYLIPSRHQFSFRIFEEPSDIGTTKTNTGHSQRKTHRNGRSQMRPFSRVVSGPNCSITTTIINTIIYFLIHLEPLIGTVEFQRKLLSIKWTDDVFLLTVSGLLHTWTSRVIIRTNCGHDDAPNLRDVCSLSASWFPVRWIPLH